MTWKKLSDFEPEKQGLYRVKVKRSSGTIETKIGSYTDRGWIPHNFRMIKNDEIIEWSKY